MSTFWRIALAWMLALALPLQGHAAQRLLVGSALPLPAAALARAAVLPVQDELNAGLHDSMKSGHAGHCDQAAVTAGNAGTDVTKRSSTGSCSACASCCHAAALPPSVPLLPLMPTALPAAPEVHLALALVWLDGLERPPRPILR